VNRSIVAACALLAASPALAADKDVRATVAASEQLFVLISGQQPEVAVAPVALGGMPYVSTVGSVQSAGLSPGAAVGVDLVANLVVMGIMDSSMREHYLKMQRKRMAPILSAVDEASLIKLMNDALAAELATVYGKAPTKTFVRAVVDEEAFFSRAFSGKKGAIVWVKPGYEFAKDKRDIRVKLDLRVSEYRSGRESRLRSTTVYAQTRPVPGRSEAEAVHALAKDGAALLKSELDRATRRALCAALLAAAAQDDESKVVDTAFINPKLSMAIKGRVLELGPDELVVDDGKGKTVLVFPVERYLTLPAID
jgi:hypothetical protein